MGEAVLCPQCGAKLRAGHARCPRCRTRIVAVDPAAAAARSRRLQGIGLGLVGAAGLVVAGTWLLVPPAATAKPGSIRDPLAARRHAAAAAPAPADEPSAAAPRTFLEPAGEAALSYEHGDYASSLKHFEDAIAKNPQDAESLSNLGQVLVRQGKPEEAIPYFQRAIALDPDRWAYVFNLARAQGLLEQWSDCLANYRKAQTLFPNDYVTTFNL
ncbi:MAG TPA: tetratricopeptide repeat protein, partial [Vicinamibacterales bacterium]|nr:tetratricopeptide repeat protein [Vicinamibacterales bacterium]